MRHYLIAGLGGVLAGALATTQIAGPLLAQETAEGNASVYQQLELFGNIFERIRTDYVEAPEDKELIEAARKSPDTIVGATTSATGTVRA